MILRLTEIALLAVYYSLVFDGREEYLANLQFTFFICGVASFIIRIASGIYTADLIKDTAAAECVRELRREQQALTDCGRGSGQTGTERRGRQEWIGPADAKLTKKEAGYGKLRGRRPD